MSAVDRVRLAAYALERAELATVPQWAAYWRAKAAALLAGRGGLFD